MPESRFYGRGQGQQQGLSRQCNLHSLRPSIVKWKKKLTYIGGALKWVIPREVYCIMWNTREVRRQRNTLKFEPIQKSFVVGTLLGDGCLLENSSETNYRLQIAHGENQKDYVLWKYALMKNWVLSPPTYYSKTSAWRFRTLSHLEFTKLRDEFYVKKQKILPKNIKSILEDPFSLAVWYMDDGTRFRNGGYTLNTQSFSKKENEMLIRCIKKIYGWLWTLHRDHGHYRIYMRKNDALKFRALISPYIISSLRYKL